MLEPSRSVIFQLYSDARRRAAGRNDTRESGESQGGLCLVILWMDLFSWVLFFVD